MTKPRKPKKANNRPIMGGGKIIEHVYDNLDNIIRLVNNNKEKRYLIIYCDDVSYSGNQIFQNLKLDNLEARLSDNPNLDYFIATTFLSNNAYDKINHPKIQSTYDILGDRILFPNIEHFIKKNLTFSDSGDFIVGKIVDKNFYFSSISIELLDLKLESTATYLQTKMPDLISTSGIISNNFLINKKNINKNKLIIFKYY